MSCGNLGIVLVEVSAGFVADRIKWMVAFTVLVFRVKLMLLTPPGLSRLVLCKKSFFVTSQVIDLGNMIKLLRIIVVFV